MASRAHGRVMKRSPCFSVCLSCITGNLHSYGKSAFERVRSSSPKHHRPKSTDNILQTGGETQSERIYESSTATMRKAGWKLLIPRETLDFSCLE